MTWACKAHVKLWDTNPNKHTKQSNMVKFVSRPTDCDTSVPSQGMPSPDTTARPQPTLGQTCSVQMGTCHTAYVSLLKNHPDVNLVVCLPWPINHQQPLSLLSVTIPPYFLICGKKIWSGSTLVPFYASSLGVPLACHYLYTKRYPGCITPALDIYWWLGGSWSQIERSVEKCNSGDNWYDHHYR